MSYYIHVDNKKEFILILGEGPTQRLSCWKKTFNQQSINKSNKKFCLCLSYNEANSYLFVNGTKIIWKQKILEF